MIKLLYLVPLLMMGFCDTTDIIECYAEPCPPDLICTEELRMITVEIKDTSGEVVELDSSYSVNNINGMTYTFEEWPLTGQYLVITDSQMEQINREGTPITFVGIKGNDHFEIDYVIGHDCCHIQMISGENDYIINTDL